MTDARASVRTAKHRQTIHAAVTGTSLIGWIDWKTNTGVNASISAASNPATPPPNCAASAPVPITAIDADRITSMAAPFTPAMACGTAINSGSPGG